MRDRERMNLNILYRQRFVTVDEVHPELGSTGEIAFRHGQRTMRQPDRDPVLVGEFEGAAGVIVMLVGDQYAIQAIWWYAMSGQSIAYLAYTKPAVEKQTCRACFYYQRVSGTAAAK